MAAVLIFVATAALTFTAAAAPNQDSARFAAWARKHAQSIKGFELQDHSHDLGVFKVIVGNSRVLELGEPAHGSHEPLALRNRLFRYAVEQLGFTAIAVETGLPESQRIADYVAGGPGDLAQVVRDNFTWGFGNFQENADLVRWMREYNAGPSHRRKIGFYGMDLSLGGPSGATPTPIAVERSLVYLNRVDPESAQRLRTVFAPYLARLPSGAESFSRDDHDRLTAAISDLVSLFERERIRYLAASSSAEYAWAYRDAIVARQEDEEFRAMPADVPGGGIAPAAWRGVSARNQAMAENVRWMMAQEGPAGRVFVFAHDAHIMNAPTDGGLWSVMERQPNAMGQYLRSTLGKEVTIIGICAGRASTDPAANNWTGAPIDFIDDQLALVGKPSFVINLKPTASETSVAAWLAKPHALRANDRDYLKVIPSDAFDAIIFIDRLSPSHGVSTE